MQTTENILAAVIELTPANRTIVGTVAGALVAAQNAAAANSTAPDPTSSPAPPKESDK